MGGQGRSGDCDGWMVAWWGKAHNYTLPVVLRRVEVLRVQMWRPRHGQEDDKARSRGGGGACGRCCGLWVCGWTWCGGGVGGLVGRWMVEKRDDLLAGDAAVVAPPLSFMRMPHATHAHPAHAPTTTCTQEGAAAPHNAAGFLH